jgi:predicted AlkP superfamily pyrophosphatase or phosphodiesterase
MIYTELEPKLGHFPLQHFWGPLSGIQSTSWIVSSAIYTAERYRPNFFYIYIPHLDYAAQKDGPNSTAAKKALKELDAEIGKLVEGFEKGYRESPLWLIASEYAIVPVEDVVYPNRLLRDAKLLKVIDTGEGETVDFTESKAFALADHQHSHVFVQDRDPKTIKKIANLFKKQKGIAEVLTGEAIAKHGLDHERTGELVLVSTPDSWQAYYYWEDDKQAPKFARTVDIHRKPGYDPVELFIDKKTKSIPLDAKLVKGSHGAPAATPAQRGVLLSSEAGIFQGPTVKDVDIAGIILRQFDHQL